MHVLQICFEDCTAVLLLPLQSPERHFNDTFIKIACQLFFFCSVSLYSAVAITEASVKLVNR